MNANINLLSIVYAIEFGLINQIKFHRDLFNQHDLLLVFSLMIVKRTNFSELNF